MTEKARNYATFVLANLIIFTFIVLLQMAVGWLFLIFLTAMHLGIVLFIVTKRRMLAVDGSLKPFFDQVFFYLALYIPLLLYKAAGCLFPSSYKETIAKPAMLAVMAISAVGSLNNAVRLHQYLFRENAA